MRATLLVGMSVLILALPSRGEDPAFDGRWWRLASHGRQIGFLNGVSDCHQYELRRRDGKFRSIKQLRDLLEQYFSDNANTLTPIRVAIAEIGKNLQPYMIEHAEGADTHPDRHGYYDGLWWRGGGPKDEQIGFVEGYISCLPDGRAMFPASYMIYVNNINKWYERHSDREKIADVLYRFATKPKRTSPK